MSKRFQRRTVEGPTPEELIDYAREQLARPATEPRKPPPELGPDPLPAGNYREMAQDAVGNLARTLQILTHRIRRSVEVDPEAMTVPDGAAKDLRTLQQVQQGLAEANAAIAELTKAATAATTSDEDLQTAILVLQRAADRRAAAKAEAEAEPGVN